MNRIKKGDTVYVNAGNDKGKTGKVLSVDPAKDRAIVEGVNMVSRHTKPNAKQPQGGIIKQEAPIHISNLNLIDPKSGKPTRVGFKVEGDKKVCSAKKSGGGIKYLWQRKQKKLRFRLCLQDMFLPSRRFTKRK